MLNKALNAAFEDCIVSMCIWSMYILVKSNKAFQPITNLQFFVCL